MLFLDNWSFGNSLGQNCYGVVRFESTPNFVVDDCKPFCNFNFVVVRIKSAPNFIVDDCKTFLQPNPSYLFVTLGLSQLKASQELDVFNFDNKFGFSGENWIRNILHLASNLGFVSHAELS